MDYFKSIDMFDNLYTPLKMDGGKPTGAPIDYENPKEVAELMAWHLSRIFRATLKKMEMGAKNLKHRKLVKDKDYQIHRGDTEKLIC